MSLSVHSGVDTLEREGIFFLREGLEEGDPGGGRRGGVVYTHRCWFLVVCDYLPLY